MESAVHVPELNELSILDAEQNNDTTF